MRKWGICATPCLLMLSSITVASEISSSFLPSNSSFSKNGLFVRVGGNYNPANFDQYLTVKALSNSTNYTGLTSYRSSIESANPYHSMHSTLAPDTQMGYFKHFKDSDRLWGVKFLYSYLGIASNDRDIDSAQVGNFSNTDTVVGSGASQLNVNHELALLAFIGQSFMNSHLYLGAGPSLFGVQSRFYDATGYAGRNGQSSDMQGIPDSLSNSRWLWGGAAQMGMTYYFNPTWFLDLSYTYAITGLSTTAISPLNSMSSAYADSGKMSVSNQQRVSAQAFTVSVKKVFSLF